MKLLAGGSPDDEYETEIEQIVKAVLENKDEIEIDEAIKDIFDWTFQEILALMIACSLPKVYGKNFMNELKWNRIEKEGLDRPVPLIIFLLIILFNRQYTNLYSKLYFS